MKIYTSINVYDAAYERLHNLFGRRKYMYIRVGGKNSTVLLELAIDVCRKLGRLPLKARKFLDPESEWQGTIDYMRYLTRDQKRFNCTGFRYHSY